MQQNPQGFDIINEGTSPAEVEKILEDHWSTSILELISARHFYWRTAILGLLRDARKKWAVLNGQLKWIEKIDPILHGAMVTDHMPYTPPGSEILVFHLELEIRRDHACVFAGNTVEDD